MPSEVRKKYRKIKWDPNMLNYRASKPGFSRGSGPPSPGVLPLLPGTRYCCVCGIRNLQPSMVKYYVDYALKFFFPNHIPDIFETLHTIGYFLILTCELLLIWPTQGYFSKRGKTYQKFIPWK